MNSFFGIQGRNYPSKLVWAGLILVLGSSSNFVGGACSRSSGGRSKKWIHFLESMVEITLGHQVWVGLVLVLDLS